MPISVTQKKIKNKIRIGDKVTVIENIKYPQFESEKHKKLCKKMNSFYSGVAEKYSLYSEKHMPKKLVNGKKNQKLPVTVSMNYNAVVCDERVVSIVLDLAFSDGQRIRTRRFSQMWSIKDADVLTVGQLLKTDRQSKKKICMEILSLADENSKNTAFGYYDDYRKRLAKNLDLSNCFVLPKGVCFFINAGILSSVKYGSVNFVLPFSKLSGIVKGEFITRNVENTEQNENIVNNV